MLLLSFFIVALVAYLAGYYIRDWKDRLDWAVKMILAHSFGHAHEKKEEDVTGSVVEPADDPISAAKAEFELEQRRLNGK
jgi:hypothetical protein